MNTHCLPAARRPGICVFIVACALVAVVCSGCASTAAPPEQATQSFISMDTAMTVTVEGPDAAAAASEVEDTVRSLDERFAPEQPGSEVALLNEQGTLSGASADLVELVGEAAAWAERTKGAFDPTVYPLTSAWGFTNGEHRVPSPDEVANLLAQVGYAAVHVDTAAGGIVLDGGAQIDVGGIAKGYAADAATTLLRDRGITSALLDLGGNVTALGGKGTSGAWNVGVTNPFAPTELVGTLKLSDATVSTSGDYQRFFVEDGVRYGHLIDPATGYPTASGLASVSVVAPSGTQADALSTALFVMGADDALALWRATDGTDAFEAVIVDTAGQVLVTEGLAEAFAPSAAFTEATTVVQR